MNRMHYVRHTVLEYYNNYAYYLSIFFLFFAFWEVFHSFSLAKSTNIITLNNKCLWYGENVNN